MGVNLFGAFLSNHVQAVVSSVLLVGILTLYLVRFGSRSRGGLLALHLAVFADQGSKALLLVLLRRGLLHRHQDFFGGRFHLDYFANRTLGFGSGFPLLLMSTLTFVLLLVLLYQRLLRGEYQMSRTMEMGLALIAGGLLGVLLDRVLLGYVVDFLEFGRQPHYIYNFADLFALTGGLLALLRLGEMAEHVRGRRRPPEVVTTGELAPEPVREAR